MAIKSMDQLLKDLDAARIRPEEFTDANFTPLVHTTSGDLPILNFPLGSLID